MLVRLCAVAAIVGPAVLAWLYDFPEAYGVARKLLYLSFGAMAVVSSIHILRANPATPMRAAETEGATLSLWVPAAAVALFAVVAIYGGFGLNNSFPVEQASFQIPADSVWLHPDSVWDIIRGEHPADAWKLFHPAAYYTLDTSASMQGHYRPLALLCLWMASGSIITVSVYALLLHALNATGLMLLARRWGADPWIAGAAGALFAWHPLPWQSLGRLHLYYPEGMALVVAALLLYDRYATTRRAGALAGAAALLGASCLFCESFLGAVGFVGLATLVFVRTGRVSRRQAAWGVGAMVCIALLMAAVLAYILLTYAAASNRMAMLQTTPQRLALAAFFESQFGFFHPLEPNRLTAATQLFAAPLAVLAGLVFSPLWGPYAGAAWLGSGLMLGPGLGFFEITSGGWSGGRMAYGPVFLLCLALAMLAPRTPRALTLTRWALFVCAVAAGLVTLGRTVAG